ncbi:MAG: hypothetical protein AAF471_08530 [Myxococcota bacterium]
MQSTPFRSHHPPDHDQQPQAVLAPAYGGPESLNQVVTLCGIFGTATGKP